MPKTNPKPHSFVIKDADLFATGRTERDLRTLVCEECGEQPGRGVHMPPPPPLSRVIADEVAKALASVIDEPWDSLFPEAPRAAFSAVQQINVMLHEMGSEAEFASMTAAECNFFDVLAKRLDDALTDLRKMGWDQ